MLKTLIVKDLYRKWKIVAVLGSSARPCTRRATQAPSGQSSSTVRAERAREDDSSSAVFGTAFNIRRLARLGELLSRLALHRMAPTNVIPANSPEAGNVSVASSVSFSLQCQ